MSKEATSVKPRSPNVPCPRCGSKSKKLHPIDMSGLQMRQCQKRHIFIKDGKFVAS